MTALCKEETPFEKVSPLIKLSFKIVQTAKEPAGSEGIPTVVHLLIIAQKICPLNSPIGGKVFRLKAQG